MSRSLALPWWLRIWRRLCGLFRRRPAKESAALPPRRIDPPPAMPARPSRPRPLQQVPATEEDIKRLGRKVAVEIARVENAKRVQRATRRARDGELYVIWPNGAWTKTSGKAAMRPDGTLIPLPPDPRPTKRERAKVRRRLKREERG